MSIEELRLPEEEVTFTSWHFGFILQFQLFKFSSLPMAKVWPNYLALFSEITEVRKIPLL